MGTLVSPGVSVTVTDESFYIPASAPTVPLFFIATRAHKFQPDGVSIADGTNEHSVVRTITSIGQSVQTYGVPYFWEDGSGAQQYGDCRNETGLFALNQFLGIGNRAFVVRANIDLTDAPVTFYSASIPQYDSTSYQYVGIGNGTLTSISVPSQLKEPEAFTVVCIGKLTNETVNSFTITGTKSGLVGVAKAGTAFVNNAIHLTITEGSIEFSAGDYFEFATAYVPTSFTGTGNGTLIDLVPGTTAIQEDFTVVFTSATSFTVTGTNPITAAVTTPPQVGTVGTQFNEVSGKVSFLITAGTTAFVAGDEFDFSLVQIQNFNALGANDAQKRSAIVTALQASINSNQDVRSEAYEYNLILAPGYHEVVDEMLALSDGIGNEAFVIGDVPATKSPEQAANWATSNEHFSHVDVAYYYPWGLASNLDGKDVLVAPSGIALRTYAYSDNAGELWKAPAGARRGVVTGVSSVGYVTGTLGLPTTYKLVNLSQPQRDNLYEFYKNINPIVYFPGHGLIIWGQKTASPAASARDRINVERLLCYIRRSLRKASFPFIFEPNDQITRDDLKSMADGFLGDIMLRRGLYDFVTLCDSSNNTPTRIDRNEMWLDVALKPVKAVEFMYIAIRVLSTGAKMGTN
jgi:hypothetical protein